MTSPQRRRRDDELEPPTSIRVLIADDDPDYRAYLTAIARRVGLDVETARDGAEALTMLDSGTFDLLLSDYEMPRRNGLELITAVRKSPATNAIYAVMLTAHDDVSLKIEALTLGYDDFLPKRCTEVEVLAKVAAARRMLGRQHALDRAVREWKGIASHDELTGVFTRRFFFDEAARLLKESHPIGIVLFDLDDFKIINDTHGHLTGDRILRDIGALFLHRTRHCDVIARFGGDEFVLLVSDLPVEAIHSIARRIVEEVLALEWPTGGVILNVHASTGIASSALLPGATVDQLLDAADRDLYKNKWLRKNPAATAEELYEYQRTRAAEVVPMPTPPMIATRKREES